MTESRDDERLAQLVREGAKGDEKALENIYHCFKTPLFGLICRYTCDVASAEDLLQDVFVTAFTHLADVNDATKLRGWLFRIAVNTSLGHLRSRKAEKRHVNLNEIDNVATHFSGEESSIILRGPLEDAIQALPERLRSVFLLHDVEGFKHEEIADILGCAVGTSKSHLFKARLRIRDRLTSAGTKIPLKSRHHITVTHTNEERKR
jgi:RNA polymerase sigma-70 factor (ECF subfamily)